jgi:hypothetical protein
MDRNTTAALTLVLNTILDWIAALGFATVLLLFLAGARALVRRVYSHLREPDLTAFLQVPLEMLSRTTTFFFVILIAFAYLRSLDIGHGTAEVLDAFTTIAIFWQSGVWLAAAARAWQEAEEQRHASTDVAAVRSERWIALASLVLLGSFIVLLAVDNLGILSGHEMPVT